MSMQTVYDFLNNLPRRDQIIEELQLDGRIENWQLNDGKTVDKGNEEAFLWGLADALMSNKPRRRFTIEAVYQISGDSLYRKGSSHRMWSRYDGDALIYDSEIESFSCHVDTERINDSYLVINARDGGRYALFLYDCGRETMQRIADCISRALSES